MTKNEAVEVNQKRLKALLNQSYNPLSGLGSPIERVPFFITSKEKIFIPKPMSENRLVKNIVAHETLEKFATEKNIPFEYALKIFDNLRYYYDFEFLAIKHLKIQDKKTKKMIPFRLNTAQLKYLCELEHQRLNHDIIRIKLLKTRQWGGSTLTENYIAWRQVFHGKRLHSVLVGYVEGQARNMMMLYKRAIKSMPTIYNLMPHEGSTKNRILEERDCIVSLGSMRNPDSLRSSDNAILHATEIGLWRTTDNNKPDDLMQSLVNSIENVPQTMIILESTAKGVGNYWHNIWQEDNIYERVFVSWFEAEKNIIPLTAEEQSNLYDHLTEEEQNYFFLGATLEGIAWYRQQLKSMSGDKWRMQSENPATPEEAFQGTGNRVFPVSIVNPNKIFIREATRYSIYSNAEEGREALQNIRIEKNINGSLKLWGEKDITKRYANRYIVSVDIGGRSDSADYSVITVIDRLMLVQGGCEEVVARARLHTTHNRLAWLAAKIATYYDNALLVIENNSLENTDEENGYTTILHEIVNYYPNLYTYMPPEKIKQQTEVRWGFFTNHATKTAMINELYKRLENGTYIEYDMDMFHELDVYEIDSKGKYNAAVGYHDDIIMSTAIGLYVSARTSVPMEINGAKIGKFATIGVDLYAER